jgi:hypothetical protein
MTCTSWRLINMGIRNTSIPKCEQPFSQSSTASMAFSAKVAHFDLILHHLLHT